MQNGPLKTIATYRLFRDLSDREKTGKNSSMVQLNLIFGKQGTQMDSQGGCPLSHCGTMLQTSDQILCL